MSGQIVPVREVDSGELACFFFEYADELASDDFLFSSGSSTPASLSGIYRFASVYEGLHHFIMIFCTTCSGSPFLSP